MKKIISICLTSAILLMSSSIFAYGGTHEVGTYQRSDGTVVEAHQAGNPGSGVHCHDNVCE